MNLGQAVAICLYELVRAGNATARSPKAVGALAGEVERLAEVLFQALQASGYVKPRSSEVTEEKLRRMVRRLQVPQRDVDVWVGMMRKMLWRMKSPRENE